MDPYKRDRDKDRNRRRRNPFDLFGFDDDDFRSFFDDRLMDDMRRMAEEMMKMFNNAQPGKPIVHGFKINIGPDGKPRIEDFGNKSVKSPEGESTISEEREPLTDIIEGEKEVAITVEIPGVDKDDINLKATEETLEITVDTPQRKYHKTVDLPCEVKPKTTKATYKSGVLDVSIKRRKKKDKEDGYEVNIE